jgi:predicted Zn-dependent protease
MVTFAPFTKRTRAHRRVMAVLAVLLLGLVGLKYASEQEVSVAREQAKQQHEAIARAMAAEYKGESIQLDQRALVARVGKAFAEKSDGKKHPLQFHLLAEPNAINLFALSSGDIYLTTALVNRMQTEGQLAAALAHGVAHVLAGDVPSAVAARAGSLPLWAYSLEQERAADARAITLMVQAGYDPNALLGMFTVLVKAHQSGAAVDFFITHPNETSRMVDITAAIRALYPQGIPVELSK